MTATAMPDGDPSIAITFKLTRAEHEGLERLAKLLEVAPATALRDALGMAIFVRALLSDGGTILHRGSDGTLQELQF